MAKALVVIEPLQDYRLLCWQCASESAGSVDYWDAVDVELVSGETECDRCRLPVGRVREPEETFGLAEFMLEWIRDKTENR